MNDIEAAAEIRELRNLVQNQRHDIAHLVEELQRMRALVMRHDRTLKIIHRGLHDTTDPEGPGI